MKNKIISCWLIGTAFNISGVNAQAATIAPAQLNRVTAAKSSQANTAKNIKASQPVMSSAHREDSTLVASPRYHSTISASLGRALELAYNNNPDFASKKANVRKQIEANAGNFASQWLPQVALSGGASKNWQKITSGPSNLPNRNYNTTYNGAITLSQPIIQGGAGINTIKNNRLNLEQAVATFMAAEQEFLYNVIEAHYGVIVASEKVKVLQYQIVRYKSDLEAENTRKAAGAKTATDVLQVETKLRGAEAESAMANAELQGKIARYYQLVGELPTDFNGEIALPIDEFKASVNAELDNLIKNNPELRASALQEESARVAINLAQADLLPNVNLELGVGRTVKRVQTATDINSPSGHYNEASAAVKFSMPLFSPKTNSAVRQAQINHRQALLTLKNAQLEKRQQLVSALNAFRASKLAVESYESAVKAQHSVLAGVRLELTLGSKTTTDLTTNEAQLLESSKALLDAKYNLLTSYYKVLALLGGLTARSLRLGVNYFDAKQDYSAHKGLWKFSDY